MNAMKKFFLGMTVLLGVSLFLTGCPTDTETETVTVTDRTGLVSGAITVAGLQDVIDAAVADGRVLTLKGVALSSAGVVDLKTVSVTIDGTLAAAGGTVVKAGSAQVAFETGAKIAGIASDVVLGATDVFAGKVENAVVAVPVTTLPTAPPAGGVTAIENLTLSDTAGDVIAGLTVYVYGNLDIAADSVAPAGNVKAIGTVTLKGDATTVPSTAKEALIYSIENKSVLL